MGPQMRLVAPSSPYGGLRRQSGGDKRVKTTSAVLASAMLPAIAFSSSAQAGDLKSVDSVIEKLAAPKSVKKRGIKTRSIGKAHETKPAAQAKLRSVLGKLRAPAFGAPVVTTQQEREEIQDVIKAEALPKLDVEIFFDYNSADIRAKSLSDLTKLGLALRDKRLAGSDFMIIGHTDASGGENYNLALSKKRAVSVRTFLVDTFGINAKNLIAIGYGEEELKRPDAPKAAENRRVQFVNLAN